jgi:GT2 family glycosyltransferase
MTFSLGARRFRDSFLVRANVKLIAASGLFDSAWYLNRYPDVRAASIDPLLHYVRHGAAEGRDPNPLFDSDWYLKTNPDVGAAGINPLVHYIEYGDFECRDPHPLFDTDWYLAGNPEAAHSNLLRHYLEHGAVTGGDPGPLFDTAWYLKQNPDVRAAGVNPLLHYLEQGASEGRDPNALFDSDWYLTVNPDVRADGVNPLTHYVLHGAAEGRDPSATFDSDWYIEHNPDVQAAGLNPLAHYLQHGLAKGRPTKPSPDADEPPAVPDGLSEWLPYRPMAQRIADDRASRLAEVQPQLLSLITVSEADADGVVAGLRFPDAARPTVSIIVPVFNNVLLTLECLLSIQRFTDPSIAYEVIVSDNASSDRTAELMPCIANLVYRRNPTDLGFLRSCNRAVESARGEFVVFLNNDAQVTARWLSALIDAFRARPKVGAVGPRVLYPSGHLQEAGVSVNVDGSVELIGLNDDPSLPRYTFARRVDYCSGACLMLERERFVALGGFADYLAPAYYEDFDLCFRLRAQGFDVWYVPEAVIIHHLSKTMQLDKMQRIIENRQKVIERWQADIDALNRVRVFAFYLPQFHQIAENDLWWGRGFTDWVNVRRAKPQFAGHHQPRLPGELGYYDLASADVLKAQAKLAERYGIAGFCFYYYWFAGHRLLEQPLEEMLASGEPDFPFLLCWANENWTRRWDGLDSEILIGQQHSDADDRAVIADLIRYFRDRRYIRVDGKPMLLVYRVDLFPDFAATAETWRQVCRDESVGEIYLAMVESFGGATASRSPLEYGCDAAVQFPPHGRGERSSNAKRALNPDFKGAIYDYQSSVLNYLRQELPAAPRFSTVMPAWDNTPRRMERATIFDGASPGAFQAWLEAAVRQTREHNFGDERIVFINAWNEWAEGAYLEPDEACGYEYLEAVRNAQDAWLMEPPRARGR